MKGKRWLILENVRLNEEEEMAHFRRRGGSLKERRWFSLEYMVAH